MHPAAALPGGEIELEGSDLGPGALVAIAGESAPLVMARASRLIVRVPDGIVPGDVTVTRAGVVSNGLHVAVGVALSENLHPVANPVVDDRGYIYTTLSGRRGQQTPVSVFRIGPAAHLPGIPPVRELRPFAREILNPTGLAFGLDGDLYVSSRAEGTIHRVTAAGEVITFAEGLGIATGIAFDAAGDLFVGDRSGTIFKIRMASATQPQETFVFATLEPSISAYHLAFDSRGVLYVTGPTTASSQAIHAIDRDGTARIFYRGLGRAQGLAFDAQDNLYVAASLRGHRGIVRITPAGEASLVVAGSDMVGLCLLAGGGMAVATRDSIFEIEAVLPDGRPARAAGTS
jgi:sugar lactone lactonase YvrE